jgi:Ca-activated chloride channel homolog
VLLCAAIVLLLTVPAVRAQFASGVNLVEVYVTVLDSRGEPVSGLTAADFQVAEDGVAQTITTFGAGDVPLSIVVALDRSFSMAGEPLTLAKRAAATFIAALRPTDEVAVLAVGGQAQTITPPVPASAAVKTAWDAIDPWGTTPLYDVVRNAIDVIQTRKGRRALLIVSDGVDRDSETTATDLIEHARRSDVLVYPVAIAKSRPAIFAELASVTGGRSVFVSDPRQLEASLVSVARELRQQYLMGYAPPHGAEKGEIWRAIDVTVNRPNLRVRARDGYYSR